MERITGCRGVVCSECDGYKATQPGDREALERVHGLALDALVLLGLDVGGG